jgi:hypothetical protein
MQKVILHRCHECLLELVPFDPQVGVESMQGRLGCVSRAGTAEWGRTFYEGGPRSGEADWLAEVISGTLIRARREWLGNTMERLLEPAVGFVQTHVV